LGKVTLVWGMRREEDLYWIEDMERLEKDFENFRFILVLSQPKEDWPGRRGHVGDVMDGITAQWEQVRAYLCGAPDMIEDMSTKLSERGVKKDRIHYEKYA